jgi:glycosyltransferase involved in cell wall biosynthesis
MKKTESSTSPLVSVIIPCYNHALYLRDAIESVEQQTYTHTEIIVVDDGSTDDTKLVASSFPSVKYIHQHNSGLSAARNKGIEEASGQYLVFLDADDWLYPDAIRINVDHLLLHPQWAFVSGWHDKVDEWKYPIEQDQQEVISERHYEKLLRGNYIGMHATVMYQRWTFEQIKFDTTLKACEDYDVYFKLARKFPVGCHSHKLAAYRIHDKNMSGKIPFMLHHVLLVHGRQRSLLATDAEREAFNDGVKIWSDYYVRRLYQQLMRGVDKGEGEASADELQVLKKYKVSWWLRYNAKRISYETKTFLKNSLPDSVLKYLHRSGRYERYTPRLGKIDAGDFERTTPFSLDFGFDRGGPIDRYYIESFLEANTDAVRGRVLEIGDNEYTLKYGGARITKSDILHIDSTNEKATFIGDLTDVPQIIDNSFDCIILTQTLHFIYDFKAALRTCHRILKPGGCLLLTVPGISHIDHGEWRDYWLWSFTDKSMRKVMAETFNSQSVEVKTYGNVYVAAAFLYGMGLPEFKKEFLDHHDNAYQVIISVRAIKT